MAAGKPFLSLELPSVQEGQRWCWPRHRARLAPGEFIFLLSRSMRLLNIRLERMQNTSSCGAMGTALGPGAQGSSVPRGEGVTGAEVRVPLEPGLSAPALPRAGRRARQRHR